MTISGPQLPPRQKITLGIAVAITGIALMVADITVLTDTENWIAVFGGVLLIAGVLQARVVFGQHARWNRSGDTQ